LTARVRPTGEKEGVWLMETKLVSGGRGGRENRHPSLFRVLERVGLIPELQGGGGKGRAVVEVGYWDRGWFG